MKSNKLCIHKSHFFLNIMKMKMKKKKRTCIKSSQQSLSSTDSIIIPEPEFYLPDDCWEHVFKFIINPVDGTKDKKRLSFKSLSLVSKHFLSIANRLIFSMKIYYPQLCFLPQFFRRFPNLNSLHLSFGYCDLDAGIALALRDRPTLKSLSISWIELMDANYIDSFARLKGLNSLKFSCSRISDDLLYSVAREGLPLKTFVLENCNGYSYEGIYGLLSKCRRIQNLGLQVVDFLNNHRVSRLSLLLPDLVSINLSQCFNITESALFAFIKNCHSLVGITMNFIYTASENVENAYNLKDFNVNPRLKFLRFNENSLINDEIIILFASIFPNLWFLDLSYCHDISGKSICQVLSRCGKIRRLHLTNCEEVRRIKMNFVVSQLKVLNLSGTTVNDKTLYEITKSCRGILKLTLMGCKYITEKGVMRVVKICSHLKEIYLSRCDKVNVDVILLMLSSRSSKVQLKF